MALRWLIQLCKHYVVYILRCQNGSLYTGYTTDLARRYAAHLAGKCKYTRSFKPVEIASSWIIHADKAQAMRVERYIKSLPRYEKDALLSSPNRLSIRFEFAEKQTHFAQLKMALKTESVQDKK